MKTGEKKKRQKATTTKVTCSNTVKKGDQKKHQPLRKQEIILTLKNKPMQYQTFQSVNNSKGTTGSNTALQASKFIQQSLRTSPKASLGEIKLLMGRKNGLDSKRLTEVKKGGVEKKNVESIKIAKEEVKKSLANVIKVYHDKKTMLDVSMIEVSSDILRREEKIMRSDFGFLSIIGEGGYGKVWKVEHNKSRNIYAMKEMSKALIVIKKSVENVVNQMKLLSKLRSPFISNMACAFNDRDNLYLVMDYLQGGDLRSYLAESDRLSEEKCKFIIACIIKALQYIHSCKIFHRDVKPQNLVIDERGYIRLTDFGIARSVKEKQSLDASGTPGYMAPQVICKQIHSFSVDFYAIGIICYEIMMGKRPYYGQNRQEIRDAILSKQHTIKRKDLPDDWSPESADFINKLIQRQPTNRLGHKSGIKQLMQHSWFRKYPWKLVGEKRLLSPLQKRTNPTSTTEKMDEYDEAVNQYKILERAEQKKDIFSDYFHSFRSNV